ncbi:MAG: YbhB/YbcL family Raf kinase inhibitor-like protein [Spirochaetales bacterium]|nr:YbhB/YbcL family Raf kinase inhibitor-like protein [Spirochaetales bacterium]
MVLSSIAFASNHPIPARFTADGADVSPPLSWTDPPAGTKSFALIVDDPDAPGKAWVHWVIYDIPAGTRELKENVPTQARPFDSAQGGPSPGMSQGINDFRRTGYGGPSPPSGTHRYVFTLYALDAALGLPPGAAKQQLLAAMKGHVLAEAKLTGAYRR